MSRLAPPARVRGPLTRLSLRMAKRQTGKLPEPFAVQAHHPRLLKGYAAFELAFQHSHALDERLKALAEMKAAALVGCEWCLDFGSVVARASGLDERQLLELPTFRESDAFSDEERLVLEYAEAITLTPAAVSDELFERLREHFDEAQLIELTYAAAIENLRARFNWALGIGSQGYSEGAVCVRAEPSVHAPSRPAPESRSV